MSGAHLYIVAYDITCPKRWRHVVKTLKRSGQRVQLSVFLCRLAPQRMAQLKMRLNHLIDTQADRLLITDLGPAGSAASRMSAKNLIAELTSLHALVV